MKITRFFAVGVIAHLIIGSLSYGSDRFDTTCARVVSALRAGDWKALRVECADTVVFERVERVYLQHFPDVAKSLADDPGWIKDGTNPTDDRDLVISHLVAIRDDLSPDESKAFRTFCSYVKDAWLVHHGRNLQGMETKSLIGPAIEWKVASNFKLLVQMELVEGKWRVRKLITDEH